MSRIPPSPPGAAFQQRIQWGANALTAPRSLPNEVPVIDKSKVDPETLKAAQGMEAMFLDYMMKVMRETVPKSSMDLENNGTRLYRGMMDDEMAKKAAQQGGIGLADQIIAYLEMRRYNPYEGPSVHQQGQGGPAVPNDQRSTGGTHEGQPVRK